MKKPELKNCIDIGSHIGFWSKDFTNTFKHTYAFDPIPQVRECYERNITNSQYLTSKTSSNWKYRNSRCPR